MFPAFKQWVPSLVCLSCDGCCRFEDPESDWRPRLGRGEKPPVLTEVPVDSLKDDAGFFRTTAIDGIHYCLFLRREDNICRVYSARPFECQLYPFLLISEPPAVWLGVHLYCPYVQRKRQDERFTEYLATLKEFFASQEAQEFLRMNKGAFPDYRASRVEIELLFPL